MERGSSLILGSSIVLRYRPHVANEGQLAVPARNEHRRHEGRVLGKDTVHQPLQIEAAPRRRVRTQVIENATNDVRGCRLCSRVEALPRALGEARPDSRGGGQAGGVDRFLGHAVEGFAERIRKGLWLQPCKHLIHRHQVCRHQPARPPAHLAALPRNDALPPHREADVRPWELPAADEADREEGHPQGEPNVTVGERDGDDGNGHE